MTVEVQGPSWSSDEVVRAGGRYPLRVEAHVGALVGKLLPGIITTTYIPRTFALHGLLYAHIEEEGLDGEEALALIRRAEVVLAGCSLAHADSPEHGVHALTAPHGGDAIEADLRDTGRLNVAYWQEPKQDRYSTAVGGFSSIYGGSEVVLGIAGSGSPLVPAERTDRGALQAGLTGLLELARQDEIALDDLRAHAHLCICACAHAPDGEWLRGVFFDPPDPTARDEARRNTARLLLRLLVAGERDNLQEAFVRRIGFGDFIDTDPVASTINEARAWRGVILRGFSVGAWRRIWSRLVSDLSTPKTLTELGAHFAADLPDVSLKAFLDGLPRSESAGLLLPAEHDLRYMGEWGPHAETDMAILCLGARRLGELGGTELAAFAGGHDDLGPRWFADKIEEFADRPLRALADELAQTLLRRALRVAYSKMQLRPDGGVWLPSRVLERDGVFFQHGDEGWNDVALRTESLSLVMAGTGVIARRADGWEATPAGLALLG